MNSSTLTDVTYQGKSLDFWMQALESPDTARRQAGAEAMVPLCQAITKVLPALFGAIRQVPPGARIQAAHALGEFGEKVLTLLPMLRSLLKASALTSRDETLRTSALHALQQIGVQPKSQVPGLIDSLSDEIAFVRASAAAALGDIGAPAKAAVPALIPICLRDPDGRARLDAAVALWKIDRRIRPGLPVLIEALRGEDELQRWIAADCLGDMEAEAREAIPDLQAALQQPIQAPLIRMSLVLALERIDPSAAA